MNLLLHDGPYWPNGPKTQIDYQSVESIERAMLGAKRYVEDDPTDLYHKGAYEYLRALLNDCYHGLDHGSPPQSSRESQYPNRGDLIEVEEGQDERRL